MKILSILALLVSFHAAKAQSPVDVADGNLIPEPKLQDYRAANRAPGILVEPYDIIESATLDGEDNSTSSDDTTL